MIQDKDEQEAVVTEVGVDENEGESEVMVEATIIDQEVDSAPVSTGVETIMERIQQDTQEEKNEEKHDHLNEEGAENDNSAPPSSTKKKRKRRSSSNTPVRSKFASDDTAVPNVKDLFVPFRVTKRIMKVDKDIGTVQNEAAMVATYALELFIEKMMQESHENAIKRGRNTVK
jgi:histone H3/H4